jgi:hypothetical protein
MHLRKLFYSITALGVAVILSYMAMEKFVAFPQRYIYIYISFVSPLLEQLGFML